MMKYSKKIMGLTLTALMTASMFAGCGAGENSSEASGPGGEDNVFTIAYAPNESTAESTDARNGLANDLSEALAAKWKKSRQAIIMLSLRLCVQEMRTWRIWVLRRWL